MTAEKENLGFNLIDQLFQEERNRDENRETVAKANSLLKSINYLMYLYGPVKFSPEHFKSATQVLDPGEYSLPEVPMETELGDMHVHVSAEYSDVPFSEGLGEIIEASLHFRMGDQTSTLTIPRTDFNDYSNADTLKYNKKKVEEAQIKGKAKLPTLEELVKVEYIFGRVWDAYNYSGLLSNIDNPNIPNTIVE